MKIKFPRNVVVDTDNIPQDFEKQIDWVGCGYAGNLRVTCGKLAGITTQLLTPTQTKQDFD